MGGVAAKLIFKSGKDKFGTEYKSLHEIPVTDIDGNEYRRLGDLINGKKAILVVNVASK